MARRDVRRRRAPRCFPTVSVLLFLLCFRPILAGSAPTLARSPPIPTLARSPPIPDLAEERSSESEVHETPGGFEVVGLHWKHVKEPYFIAVWILVASLAKLLFHLSHRLSAVIPESCLLIVLGLLLGGVVWGAIHQAEFTLTPTVFFFYLLPPIVFDAGYFMPSRLFFDNLGAILTYAVFGTVWNAATTGLSLYGVYCLGSMGPLNVTVLDFLLFGSLIAAVDPVAVLAVFEEVHVNEVLFIIVFGESLLNDAVTVVLYKVFDSFAGVGITNIQTLDYVKGIGSFFVVALGGTAVGVVFAFFMSLVTRFTKHVKIMEPAFILTLAYLSYLTAEMFSLSSILAITFCGICCRRYVEANVDAKSQTTVWYTLKLLASSAETIIFIFLGISAIDTEKWTWNTSFILLTLLFISVFRIIGVVLQTWLLNIGRVVPLNYIDQAVMSYGGLRGAVAFALVALLDEEKVPEKRLFLSTTIIVVFFTIVIQDAIEKGAMNIVHWCVGILGLTIKPLVKFLKVKLSEEHQPTLSEEMYLRVFDHTLTAVEDIVGQIGHHYVRDKWEYFDRNYLSKVLMRPMARMNKSNLWDLYHDLNVKDAISFVQQKEKSGSLAFVHSPGDKASNINFTALAPSDTELSLSNMLRKSDTNVLLDMQAVDVVQRCPNDSEDIIVHRMLSNSLYQTYRRRQPRYSRHMMKNDLQHKEEREIFKRNMLNRLQSFKSSKQGKHIRGKRRHKVSVNGHSGNGDLGNCSWSDKYNGVCKSDVIVEEEEDENGITFIAMGPSNAHEEGFTNLTFKPDDTTYRLPPPWLLVENSTPPVNAQPELPQPSWPFSRLIPLRGSRRSNDSLVMVDNSTFKVPSRASSPERSTRCCTLSPQRSQSPPPMQSSPRRVLTSPQGEDESVRDQGESAKTPQSSDSSATVSKSTHDLPETKF